MKLSLSTTASNPPIRMSGNLAEDVAEGVVDEADEVAVVEAAETEVLEVAVVDKV